MAVAGVHRYIYINQRIHLSLLDQPIKDLANLLGTLLWKSLLAVLIVDKSNTETGLVALGPFEVARNKLVGCYIKII
jgi:hypothetical protein